MARQNRFYRGSGESLTASPGWRILQKTPPASLFGANGMSVGPDGRLYITQAWGSQVSALDLSSGAIETILPMGGPIAGPDDIAFNSKGAMFMTEVFAARVAVRDPDGKVRVLAEDLPAANGITIHNDRIFVTESRPDGRVLELFEDGRPPRVLIEKSVFPNGCAVGPDGKLYFAMVWAHMIMKVGLDGGEPELVLNLGAPAKPTSVRFHPDWGMVVSLGGTGEILVTDPATPKKAVLVKLAAGIDNMAFDAGGRLFVSHFVDGAITEITWEGRVRTVVQGGYLGPWGIAAGRDGAIFVGDGMSLAMIAPDGARSRPALLSDPGVWFVRGVAVAPDGDVVMTSTSGTIDRIRPDGTEGKTVASGFQDLMGVTVAEDGTIFAVEAAGRVVSIPASDKPTASGLQSPSGIAAGPDGSLYVSESKRGRVIHIAGGVIKEIAGGFKNPQGLALAGDDLFVLDAGARALFAVSLSTNERRIIAEDLPVGAPKGITPKLLPLKEGSLPGPFYAFAGIAAGPGGSIYISADGEGSVLEAQRTT